MKSIIYYTDNTLRESFNLLDSLVKMHINRSELYIVSSSLKPIRFGDNEVIEGERGYITMVKQIISCLERSIFKYVFFCEHDVLYHKSHFDFVPPKDDVFYYNENVWRWKLGTSKAIKHHRMIPLSSLCVNREFALEHYKKRLAHLEKFVDLTEKEFYKKVRIMGFEPGTKKKKRGGITNDDFDTWSSKFPIIDVRHKGTFSPTKIKLEDFKHKPIWWREIPLYDIKGWDWNNFNL